MLGGTLYYSGASGTMSHGLTVAADGGITTDNDLTLTGPVAYSGGAFTKLGDGTLLFNTPTATTNALALSTPKQELSPSTATVERSTTSVRSMSAMWAQRR